MKYQVAVTVTGTVVFEVEAEGIQQATAQVKENFDVYEASDVQLNPVAFIAEMIEDTEGTENVE